MPSRLINLNNFKEQANLSFFFLLQKVVTAENIEREFVLFKTLL